MCVYIFWDILYYQRYKFTISNKMHSTGTVLFASCETFSGILLAQ